MSWFLWNLLVLLLFPFFISASDAGNKGMNNILMIIALDFFPLLGLHFVRSLHSHHFASQMEFRNLFNRTQSVWFIITETIIRLFSQKFLSLYNPESAVLIVACIQNDRNVVSDRYSNYDVRTAHMALKLFNIYWVRNEIYNSVGCIWS